MPVETEATRLGGMLRAMRQQALLTQEELARRAGVSIATIAGLEAGRTHRPRISSVRLLADALGLDARQRRAFLTAARSGEPEPAAATAPPALPVPAQLPADVADFTGRAAHLEQLDALLPAAEGTTIAVIGGTAGVGKTTLAIHWGHRVRDQFPDGQLYVDLRGYSPGSPLTPIEALAGFLHALGTPGGSIPVAVDHAAALYRSVLAGKRALVVLDNALGVDQVRPLLPGAGSGVVVVTSRDSLPGLVAAPGARWLDLDVLPARDAYTLLSRTLGAERVAAEPAAAGQLTELCGYLPLALRVAGANLAVRPRQRIAEQVAQLRERDRLAELAVPGDPRTTVSAALGLSYARLPDPARRLFRLLGLVRGPDVTAGAAGALVQQTPQVAAELLATLARAHLLEESAAGRYTSHDLLRHYAAGRAAQEESAAARAAARRRLLDWYVSGAEAAASTLYSKLLRLPDAPPAAAESPFSFGKPSQAQAWLEAEHANLIGAIADAAEHGPRPVTWRLAHALRGFWCQGPYLVDGLAAATAAAAAARADGDLPGQAAAQLSLGFVHDRLGRHREALAHFDSAAALARRAGWADWQLAALSNAAVAHWRLGRLQQAAADFTETLGLSRKLARPRGQAVVLNNLGAVRHDLGQLADATADLTESLSLYRRHGMLGSEEISPLHNLGCVARDLGRLDEARDHLGQALDRCREHHHRADEAHTLDSLATVHREAGELAEASEAAEAAVALAGEIGDRHIEASARNTLGSVRRRLGRPRTALREHRRALDLAGPHTDLECEIDARLGLALAHNDLGHHDRALAHANQGIALARESGYRLREGQALTILAEIHLDQGDQERAREYAERALDHHRQTGHRPGEARTRPILARLGHQAGDARAARIR
jgi:tetratricopeptide (TPR) repeat protein/transcriptional regulator with XRE-family HTH domain